MSVSASLNTAITTLMDDARIQRALAFLEQDHEATVHELKEMVLVSGAPNTEPQVRSPMFRAKLEQYGLEHCFQDALGNVFGFIHGSSLHPEVVCEGHLDTVFPEETVLRITERGGRLLCPGIGDDTAALAMILSVVRAIRNADLQPVGTLMLGGTVGEEAPGLARGIRGLMTSHADMDACLSIDTGETARIIKDGVACQRFSFEFSGPGGHSWNDFGRTSPIGAAARAVVAINALEPPATPKTTCSVGLIHGGTSVNAIANTCSIEVDIRSIANETRDRLVDSVRACVQQGVEEENSAHPGSAPVSVVEKPYGTKPGGVQGETDPIVQLACLATQVLGITPVLDPPASTNSNFPISAGIPALCLGTGGKGGAIHTLDEWYEPAGSYTGAQRLLLMLFALCGLDGVLPPLLPFAPTE